MIKLETKQKNVVTFCDFAVFSFKYLQSDRLTIFAQ